MEENIINEMQDDPTLTVEVGKVRYEVGIHFSEDSDESMENKIKRLITQEVRERLSTS